MSWNPPSSGIWDPQSRTAPRPSGSTPIFSFGHFEEQQHHQAAGAKPGSTQHPQAAEPISQRPQRACFDPPVEQLRWWQQPRNQATVSGIANSDVEAFWGRARQEESAVAAMLHSTSGARQANKAQACGSTVAASLADPEQPSMAQAQSCYKSAMTAQHVRVGKRGVAQSAAAVQAYEESRQQAQRNKQVGRATNMQLALF